MTLHRYGGIEIISGTGRARARNSWPPQHNRRVVSRRRPPVVGEGASIIAPTTPGVLNHMLGSEEQKGAHL